MLVGFTVKEKRQRIINEWIGYLEKGELEKISVGEDVDTGGYDPGYFFITSIEKAFRNKKCSESAYNRARKWYGGPNPCDF